MSVYVCRSVGVRVWVGLLGSWVGLGGEPRGEGGGAGGGAGREGGHFFKKMYQTNSS